VLDESGMRAGVLCGRLGDYLKGGLAKEASLVPGEGFSEGIISVETYPFLQRRDLPSNKMHEKPPGVIG